MNDKQVLYVNRAGLIERGWPPDLIDRLLGPPDENRLWRLDHVEAARQRIAEAIQAPLADPKQAMEDVSYELHFTPEVKRRIRLLFGDDYYDRSVVERLILRMMPPDAGRLLQPGPGAPLAWTILLFRAARAVAHAYPRLARYAFEFAEHFSGTTERKTALAVSAVLPELAHLFTPKEVGDAG